MSTQTADDAGQQPPRRLLYSMAEAAELLSVQRNYLYTLQAAGKLKTVKMGRRRLVTADELDRLIANLKAGLEL